MLTPLSWFDLREPFGHQTLKISPVLFVGTLSLVIENFGLSTGFTSVGLFFVFLKI
jgi:hypothetical protein